MNYDTTATRGDMPTGNSLVRASFWPVLTIAEAHVDAGGGSDSPKARAPIWPEMSIAEAHRTLCKVGQTPRLRCLTDDAQAPLGYCAYGTECVYSVGIWVEWATCDACFISCVLLDRPGDYAYGSGREDRMCCYWSV